MKRKTAFSVCMSTYHGDDPRWLREAVDSVIHQTVPPSEIILVVDGPVGDGLDAVIREYEQMDLFQVIRLAENQGTGSARRAGLESCACEIVTLMDADDISVPDRFEKQLAALEADEKLSIVGGQIREFMGSVENTVGIRSVPLTDSGIKADMETRCPMNHMTVMFRKADIRKAGGYLDWYCNEDYYLWLRMYLAGMKFANVPEILVNVRVGEDLYRRRGGWKYFCSEMKLQNYMLKNKVIGLTTYTRNAAKRLVVQLLLPNRLRGWVYRKFARTNG